MEEFLDFITVASSSFFHIEGRSMFKQAWNLKTNYLVYHWFYNVKNTGKESEYHKLCYDVKIRIKRPKLQREYLLVKIYIYGCT